jgi:hypothetical protein
LTHSLSRELEEMRSQMTYVWLVGIVALRLAGTRLAAQTPRLESPLHAGGWIVGGTGAFDMTNNQTSFGVGPSALVFVNSRLAVGGESQLNISSTSNGHSSTWGLGPTARLFLGDSEHLLPFISATVLPEWAHQFQGSLDFDERLITLDGSLGATYLLASHAGLTGEAYATHFSVRTTNPGNASSVGGITHYGVRFGFTVFVH